MKNHLKKLFSGLLSLGLALGALWVHPAGASAQFRILAPASAPVLPAMPVGALAPLGAPTLSVLPSLGAPSAELSELAPLSAAPEAEAVSVEAAQAAFSFNGLRGTPQRDMGLVRHFAKQYQEEGSLTFISDLDDTLSDNSNGKGTAISDELVSAIVRLQAKGVRLILNTNRPFNLIDKASGRDNGARALFADRLPANVRAGLIMAVESGAQVWQFGPNGETPEKPAWVAPGFSPEEKESVSAIVAASLAETGLQGQDLDVQVKEHQAVIVLKQGREKMGELAESLNQGIRAAGLSLNVIEKQPSNKANPPYVVVSSLDKSTNTRGIRKMLQLEGVTPKPSSVLLIGDDFDQPGFDTAMQRGWPGASSLSVGHKVSPEAKNVYLYSKAGPDSSLEFFKRLADALDAL